MKHACVFRDQYLNNTFSVLKAIELISSESKEVISLPEPPTRIRKNLWDEFVLNLSQNNHQLATIDTSNIQTDSSLISSHKTDKFFKGQNSDFTINLVNNLKEHLEKKNQTNHSNEINKQLRQFIRQTPEYDEIPFEEDDILLDLKLEDEQLPASTRLFQERCKYCKRRYMFQETFEKHVNECIVKSLTNYIWEINYCLQLKNEKQITTNQFIQRMTHNIKNGNQVLEDYHRGVGGLPHALTIVSSNDNTLTLEDKFKFTTNFSNYVDCDRENSNTPLSSTDDDILTKLAVDPTKPSSKNPSLLNSSLNLLDLFASEDGLIDVSQTYEFDSKNSPSPSIHNGKLVNDCIKKPKPHSNRSKPTITPNTLSHSRNINNLDNQYSNNSKTDSYKGITCKMCEQVFVSIQHLDYHYLRSHSK